MTSSDSDSTDSKFLNELVDKAEKMGEQARSAVNRSQQAVTEALANWAVTTQAMMQPPTPQALQAMPKPTELVDRGFEIAEQLLKAQHSFATKLMESMQGPLTEAATKAASATQDVSDAGAASTQAATEGASQDSESLTATVKKTFSKSA